MNPRRLLLPALFLAFTAYAIPTYAQDPQPAEPVTAAVDAPKVDEAKPEIKIDGDKVTVGEVVTDAGELVKAISEYKAAKKEGKSGKATTLLFLLILTAAFKILLSAVKLSSKFWKGRKGKTILRLTTVTLGVAVWLTAQWGMGVGWFDAVVLGFSGPLAVALHEYQYLIPALANKKDKKKEE